MADKNTSTAISMDVLVMMLRIVGVFRALLQTPTVSESAGSAEIRETVQDLERRIAATLRALDELAEEREHEDNGP